MIWVAVGLMFALFMTLTWLGFKWAEDIDDEIVRLKRQVNDLNRQLDKDENHG